MYFETYGCALNKADSMIMMDYLEDSGHIIVDNIEDADVIIVNTCTVRLDTEQRVIKRLKQLKSYVNSKRVIVAGCMVRAEPYLVAKTIPEASLIIPQSLDKIVDVINNERRTVVFEESLQHPLAPKRLNQYTGIIPINYGCLGKCSFCITRRARGKLRSMQPKRIVEYILTYVKNGAKEIYLASQDSAAYGYDLGDVKLPDLLQYISDILDKHGFSDYIRIRVGMMNPWPLIEFVEDLVYAISHQVYYKFLHIPLQSGDNRVLKIMNRKHSVEEYVEIVKKIRNRIPGPLIATDIIVGHPGEDEEAFNNTKRIIKELAIERVHIAQYTLRPHTLSASMKQIPDFIKKKRSKELVEIAKKTGLEANKSYIGKRLKVIVVGKNWRRNIVSRTYNYQPVIIINSLDMKALKTHMLTVLIKDATYYDLKGEIVFP